MVESLLEAACRRFIQVDKLHGEPVAAPRVERLGRQRHPADARQIDLHPEPDPGLLLVAGIDEAPAPAQIEDAQRGFDDVHAETIERAREALVSSAFSAVNCREAALDDLHGVFLAVVIVLYITLVSFNSQQNAGPMAVPGTAHDFRCLFAGRREATEGA